jgi:hypothetical protein
MMVVLLLAAVLAGSLALFLVQGREQLARRDQAHLDLLRRETDLDRLLATLGTPDDTEFEAQLAEHGRLVATARERFELLAHAEPGSVRPRLAELLAGSPCAALQPGTALHASLRAQAGLPPAGDEQPGTPPSAQEQALASVVEAVAPLAEGLELDTLELKAGGEPLPVTDVAGLSHVQAQLVVSGALPDMVRLLEALSPRQGGGLPVVSVLDASLRRIEPSRWGENLRQLATPPVRLTASLDILLPATGGP